MNGRDEYITIPLKKDSDFLHVKERFLAENWDVERKKMLNRITESYRKAPFFNSAIHVIEELIMCNENNLFKFVLNSLNKVKEYIRVKTPFTVSSTISIDHTLKAEKKVLEICQARKASDYVNPIGGVELYNRDEFKKEGINLHFIKTENIQYKQFSNEFIPSLSIIDIMMFNSENEIKEILNLYKLV